MGLLAIGFWAGLGIKLAILAAIVPVVALPIIFAELKLSAHMQHRIGPYFAGGRYGWAQPLADGLKFFQKEDLIPASADKFVYKVAPYLVMAAALGVFVIIPFGPDLIGRNLDVGIFVGSFGLFFTCFCLFSRFLPFVAMSEVKGTLKQDEDFRALVALKGPPKVDPPAEAQPREAVV